MKRKTRVPVLGVEVTPMTADDVVSLLSIPPTTPKLIAAHNLHSTYLWRTDRLFYRFYGRCEYVVIDGRPVLTMLNFRSQSRLSVDYRIGSTDWIEQILSRKHRPVDRVYILGGSKDVLRKVLGRFASESPMMEVGGRDGYFEGHEEATVVAEIKAFAPDLVLVGLGMPKQEHFLESNLDDLPPAYYATVGGALDFIAGETSLAPRWVGRIGLEWLWRLVHEPRRLGRRYLIEPWRLVGLIVHELLPGGRSLWR